MIADLLARASALSIPFYVALCIAAAWSLFTIGAALWCDDRPERRVPRPRRSSGVVSRSESSERRRVDSKDGRTDA